MTKLEKDRKFEQLVQKFEPQSKLLRTWELKGGISAQVTALEFEQANGQTKKIVVRQYGEANLRQNPQIAATEFKLLQIVQSAGVAVPTPLYFDQSGEFFATPYLVIEYIEGKSEFAPADLADFLFQSATQLSKIHKIDCTKLDLAFLPNQEEIYTEKLKKRPAQLDESLDEGHIRDILEAVWPLPKCNKAVLLHGDFWPGNLLWENGQLVAVIDWEDAESGDPLADLANTRLEILWAFGSTAMDRFTRHYKSRITLDFTNLPYWDLFAALRPAARIGEWAADELIEKTMRAGHKLFIMQAFEKLAVQ